MMEPVLITGAEAACALGTRLEDCLAALRARRGGLQRLGSRLGAEAGLGDFATLPAGLLPERALLRGRRYGAAGNAAVHLARAAVQQAGWSKPQTGEAWVFAASSRGNVGEEAGSNAWRRPLRRFSASNSMHSEIAAAVSIELGIRGPWQMISNGCSSGLDALGLAWMAVAGGLAPRALVVAVDLPFVPRLLRDFNDTGLLSRNGVNDPFALENPATSGFLPGEAVVAVTLERDQDAPHRPLCRLERYFANSDAYDALMIPADGGGISDCVAAVWNAADPARVVALCPHATGTLNHARAEPPALQKAMAGRAVPLLPLKPHTGHALGASGLLDVALLAGCMAGGALPAVLPGLTAPACGLELLEKPLPLATGDRVVKLASGMGGHNAAVSLAVL
ncbi:MAG TPA: beta-ketoacyl synthase N-terminal-like domain-containing protein [Prosthecobacter sp.]